MREKSSTDNANSEDTSTENNNEDETSNSDSITTNESNIEEVEEEQTQDANSDQADSPENSQEASQENVISKENGIPQEQIDEENSKEEVIDTEQIDNTEENTEELEQANNDIINEEEPITNEEAGISTMSEEGEDADEEIATLAEGETPTTVFELQTSVNQYVWVPVKDISRIYGVDGNGKLWGKLYNYSSSGRTNNNWSESSGVMSIADKTGFYSYLEPDVVRSRTAYDADSKIQGYRDGIEQYQMLIQEMEESFYKMIESVKKYGGFYIGRYETGDLGEEEAVVKKMNTDINYQTWYTMYEKCKNLAGENENVETSMIWGSLWDETLQWLVDSEAKISTGETIDYTLINNSTNWGNYNNATFEYTTTSGGTSTTSSSTRIPTGSADYTKANNIYDMAGNVYDWTLEASSTYGRVLRGGSYSYGGGSSYPVRYRSGNNPTGSSYLLGCRSALYIK